MQEKWIHIKKKIGKFLQRDEQMEGWIDRKIYRWMDKWIDRWVDREIDRQIHKQMERQIDIQLDRQRYILDEKIDRKVLMRSVLIISFQKTQDWIHRQNRNELPYCLYHQLRKCFGFRQRDRYLLFSQIDNRKMHWKLDA